jgi:hypothetical protein
VRFEQSPHGLGLDAFVQEVQNIVQTGLREPYLLADPLLDLLEIDLEDLGSEVGDEVLGDLGVVDLVVLAQGSWVAISVLWSVGLCRIGGYLHT